MAIAIVVTDRNVENLKQKIVKKLDGQVPVWIYPDIPKPYKVKMAVLWKHPIRTIVSLPQLELVSSLGAGVEHILSDPNLTESIRVVRIVDQKLPLSMSKYVLMAVLNIHKNFLFYQANQKKQNWARPEQVEVPMKIGILGLGELGQTVAKALADLKFEVFGYSLTKKRIKNVTCVSASEMDLAHFVHKINVLICLLPRTPQTESILNYKLFKQLPKGSHLINVARGAHLVEADLLKAIEEGYIIGFNQMGSSGYIDQMGTFRELLK